MSSGDQGWCSWAAQLATRASATAARAIVEPLALAAGRLPPARPLPLQVRVQRDLPYHRGGHRAHRLDVYGPAEVSAPLPTVLYIHGGGFQMLSKGTHRMMAMPFARRGMRVVNVDYRLSPRYPFPAALIDCVRALHWLIDHAAPLGFDVGRLVVAGESAGANLATALCVLCAWRRPEPWAAALFDRGIAPQVLVANYGLLQTSEPERFRERKPQLSALLHRHLVDMCLSYRDVDPRLPVTTLELADPVVLLERLSRPHRPLPACFAAVGTKDPLLDDTRRLARAYQRLGVPCRARYFPGQLHGFNALGWARAARQCWAETFEFIEAHV